MLLIKELGAVCFRLKKMKKHACYDIELHHCLSEAPQQLGFGVK